MKRKLHPRRRHGRHHLSAADRFEIRCEGYFAPFGRTPTREGRFPTFPRARVGKRGRPTMNDLAAAGYGFASLEKGSDWSEVHAWLKARCTNAYGREYTWFGGTFFFARPAHRDAFLRAFPCAEGYSPMFAFETLQS